MQEGDFLTANIITANIFPKENFSFPKENFSFPGRSPCGIRKNFKLNGIPEEENALR
jgi:hypothetical protein